MWFYAIYDHVNVEYELFSFLITKRTTSTAELVKHSKITFHMKRILTRQIYFRSIKIRDRISHTNLNILI